MREVAAANGEQAKGAEQVNAAVTQMNEITQTNATNAEETVATGEELSARTPELNSLRGDLEKVVGAKNGNGKHKLQGPPPVPTGGTVATRKNNSSRETIVSDSQAAEPGLAKHPADLQNSYCEEINA